MKRLLATVALSVALLLSGAPAFAAGTSTDSRFASEMMGSIGGDPTYGAGMDFWFEFPSAGPTPTGLAEVLMDHKVVYRGALDAKGDINGTLPRTTRGGRHFVDARYLGDTKYKAEQRHPR